MKRSKSKKTKRDFFSWAMEHISPSISFEHPELTDDYWETHGGKPDITDVDAWSNYVADNATFWIKFKFDF